MNTYCASCGSPVVAGLVFCRSCGQPVSREPAPAPAEETTASASPATAAAPAYLVNVTPPLPSPAPSQRNWENAVPAMYATQSTQAYPYTHDAPHYPAGNAVAFAEDIFRDDKANRRGAPVWIAAAAGVALLGTAGFFGARSLFGSTSSEGEPVSVSAATTPSVPAADSPSAPATPDATASSPAGTATASPQPGGTAAPGRPGRTRYKTASGFSGKFEKAATLTPVTSEPFLHAVAEAYAESEAEGESVVLDEVYSSATDTTYVVTCTAQSDETVLCTAGANGQVLLYN